MKATYKVNIGGCAFNMDEDAYKMFDEYFNSLKIYFRSNEECTEIIYDIELRVSELLQMRINAEHDLVSGKDSSEIIKMMGTPTDLGESDPEFKGSNTQTKSESNIKKRLYRDTNAAILGGVFGGVGHYLKFDPVLLRAIYIVLLYLGFLVSAKVSMILMIIYFAMWIIMPKAKTMHDKLSMTGIDPSISNIENRTIDNNKYRGSFFRTILKAFVYLIFGVLTLASSLALVLVIVGFVWLSTETTVTLSDYLGIFGLDTFNFKVSILLVTILPILGILYFSLKVLFRSRLAARDFVISVIAILVFVSSGAYMGLKTYKQIGAHKYSTSYTEQLPLYLNSDTISVILDKKYFDAMHITPYSGNFYMLQDNGMKSFFALPYIKVVQDNKLQEIKVDLKKSAYERNHHLAKTKAEKVEFNYRTDSTKLVISPTLYNKNRNWTPESYEIIIYTPSNKTVIIDDQIRNNRGRFFDFVY